MVDENACLDGLDVVNGFGVEDRVVVSDEPMLSLYGYGAEQAEPSNVVRL